MKVQITNIFEKCLDIQINIGHITSKAIGISGHLVVLNKNVILKDAIMF